MAGGGVGAEGAHIWRPHYGPECTYVWERCIGQNMEYVKYPMK